MNGVVAQSVDEDVAGPSDHDIIGGGQGGEPAPRWIQGPHGTALIGHENPSVVIGGGPHRPRHAAADLGGGLAVEAHSPDDPVRTVRHDYSARGVRDTRQDRPDTVDAFLSGAVRKRAPLTHRVGDRVDGNDPIATLLGDEDLATPQHDNALGHVEPARDPLHRAIDSQRRNGSGVDIAEEQPPVIVEGEVIRSREVAQQRLRTGRGAGPSWARAQCAGRWRGARRWRNQSRLAARGNDGQQDDGAFDHDPMRVYHGVVLKVISAPELAKNLDPILQALEESGTTLIIKHHDQPAALLVRFDAYVAMLATMDYSGWERWIDEVRMAFPTTVFSPPRRPKAIVPAFIDPADLGYAPQLGQVGTSAGRRRLAEELATMGIQLEDQQLGPVYSLVLSLAERKRALYTEDLKLAVEEALGRATPGRFALKDLQVNVQSGVSSTAEVSVSDEGALKTGTASGDGTLDAVFRAIQHTTGVPAELEDFSLAAATQGSDALGEAVVTLSQGSHVVVGRALALDVVEAAANAYLNALNWLVRPQGESPSLSLSGNRPLDSLSDE